MAFVTPDTLLSDIILANPSLIPVLSRFDISLGVGNSTISCLGQSHPTVDTDFLVTIINTYLCDDYFPEHSLKEFQATTIVKYLRETYSYYRRFALPNIERHFKALVAASGDNNNLRPILSLFETIVKSFNELVKTDELSTFNRLDTLDDAGKAEAIQQTATTSEMIDDLSTMLVVHLQGSVDQNLCYAVVNAVISFSGDFGCNCRIRNRILLG